MIKYLLLVLIVSLTYAQTNIEQRLSVIENDRKLNGTLLVGLEVRGVGLDTATTIGSATIDISYDKSIIEFIKDSASVFQLAEGYEYTVNEVSYNDVDFIRIGIFGIDVNGLTKNGYNLTDVFERWITLKFKILNAAEFADLFVLDNSNAIGLFKNEDNHQYEPDNNMIVNAKLAEPVNILSEPLPVELDKFNASIQGNHIYLEWTTITETNNSGFEIYRSSDNNNWNKISFIKGNVTTTTSNKYTYVDQNPVGGSTFQYKLKQIDLDGSFKYSEVKEVLLLPNKYELFGNYPNPFNPTTNIKYSLPVRSSVEINIYSITGEKIKSIIKSQEAGIYNESVDLQPFSSGAYIYSLEANEEDGSKNYTSFKKMLLIK